MTNSNEIHQIMADIGARAKKASSILACASGQSKEDALMAAADAVWARRGDVIAANIKDLDYGRDKGLSGAMMDRLMLDEERIQGIVDSLRNVAAQEDPIGDVITEWDMESGLHIKRVRTPLGVIGVIYESRPNVTADAGALCLKAGNAVILRGGSDSFNSSGLIHDCMVEGLEAAGLPKDAIQRVPTRERAAVKEMLTMVDTIDVIVPRGGKGLVGLVQREARVPVFAHLEGIVHIYIDKGADAKKTRAIVMNSKTRRTGICGAAECLLIHRDAVELGQQVIDDLMAAGVEVRAGEGLNGSVLASEDDFGFEYLDMIIAAKIVENVDGAIAHIQQFGSNHTDAILSEDAASVAAFFNQLDSAILMHNASTQFADGGEFGMGAEIGIATGKMHARGPVGSEQLTSFKYIVTGNGAIRS